MQYVYKNIIYFGKRPQMGKRVVSKVLAHLLQNEGDIIGISWYIEDIEEKDIENTNLKKSIK